MKVKAHIDLSIPVVVVALFVLLSLTGLVQLVEGRFYNAMLGLKPAPEEDPSLLLLDFDDTAIAGVGSWPVSRHIMADGLLLMREFGARYAVFDIEYVDRSPRGVDARFLEEKIPEFFTDEFAEIQSNINDLSFALQEGFIPLDEAKDFFDQLSGLAGVSKAALLEKVQQIVRDNDLYLGQAARFFGNAFFTVNMQDEIDEAISKDLKQYFVDTIANHNITVRHDFPTDSVEILPTIRPVIIGARGAGFPNVIIDEDGVRRRIDLVRQYQGHYFGQLAFSPLLHWLGNPEIVLDRGRIVLKQADHPRHGVEDITIPLAEDNTMLINWPRATFLESFRHMTFYELILHDELLSRLLYNLKLMEARGYLGRSGPYRLYEQSEEVKTYVLDGGEIEAVEEYVDMRRNFFEELGAVLLGEAESDLLAQIGMVLSQEDLSEDVRDEYVFHRASVPESFSATRDVYESLMKSRARLGEGLEGAFCVIGHTGTGTTDIGVNPFEEQYMNVGTHAAIANTILSERFLDDVPWWYSVVLALIVTVGVTVFVRRLAPLQAILVGFGVFLIIAAAIVVFFVTAGIYVQIFVPSASVFLTFVSLTVMKFLRTEKEKSFLRNAFSHYLSADVIKDLVSDPDRLKLGGEQKFMTAIFTDVKGFSTISEQLTPGALVALLNEYLSAMSDTILDELGTIDKYEGDAIISFFGAPVEMPDHAKRACRASVRMKAVELELNKRFLEEKTSPGQLLTRIGINTGDMVVGNMGTARKMDYTIMGNSVNLAARLEGVNKQYGTWILTSDATIGECDDEFTARKLDRVRVVGIQEPVRLYELIDEKGNTPKDMVESVEIFHQGLDSFEEREWEQAADRFREVLKIFPEDPPAKLYLRRCEEYLQKAPPASWDGVFNLQSK